jgi:O-6-methylguanine DNA methyltransferase
VRRVAVIRIPTAPELGALSVSRDANGHLRIDWLDPEDPVAAAPSAPADPRSPVERRLIAELQRVAEGRPADFSGVPTPPGPPFHRACWDACRRIPPGETRTYAELARMAGGPPGAARAAGQAMRANRLPVAIPCHRVLAAGGGLGGYAGSNDPRDRRLLRKRWLLDNESRTNRPIEVV